MNQIFLLMCWSSVAIYRRPFLPSLAKRAPLLRSCSPRHTSDQGRSGAAANANDAHADAWQRFAANVQAQQAQRDTQQQQHLVQQQQQQLAAVGGVSASAATTPHQQQQHAAAQTNADQHAVNQATAQAATSGGSSQDEAARAAKTKAIAHAVSAARDRAAERTAELIKLGHTQTQALKMAVQEERERQTDARTEEHKQNLIASGMSPTEAKRNAAEIEKQTQLLVETMLKRDPTLDPTAAALEAAETARAWHVYERGIYSPLLPRITLRQDASPHTIHSDPPPPGTRAHRDPPREIAWSGCLQG